MADMRQSPEGRARLSRLAAAVTDTFVPIIGAARSRCGALADWALGRAGA